MLLRFGAANHRSICGYQELLLSASKATRDEGLVMPVPTMREAAVPVVAIYGANAAGKSNLIDAMHTLRRYVLGSHTRLDATETIPRDPFALNGDAGTTRLDCTFTVDGSAHDQSNGGLQDVYEYGFEYTGDEFRREWLYRMVRQERLSTQTLFDRETEGGTVRVSFGSQLRGENRTIANLTRPNSLFLSASAQNNHPQLTTLYTYFAKDWKVVSSEQTMSGPNAAERLWNFVSLDRLVELVRQADVGIDEIGVGEEVVDEGKRLYFIHSGADGRQAVLDYDMQSKGTRTLITLLIPALEALAAGSLLVVDELDTSLHPDLARAFVSLFSNPESNPHGAQVIFSTHDVTLLNSGLLRRDEIWMADKDRQGASRFVPLSDFKLRSRDDIERAYRNGRVGGVPLGNEFHIDFDDSLRAVER